MHLIATRFIAEQVIDAQTGVRSLAQSIEVGVYDDGSTTPLTTFTLDCANYPDVKPGDEWMVERVRRG